MIKMIVAVNKSGTIGFENQLPWSIKDDMKIFKENTKDSNILMGKKTFESLGCKPLPKRNNIVISNSLKPENYETKNCLVTSNIEAILKKYKNRQENLWIIGGRAIYDIALPFVEEAFVSIVDDKTKGDVFLPFFWEETYISGMKKWNNTFSSYYPVNEKNQYAFTFNIFKRSTYK